MLLLILPLIFASSFFAGLLTTHLSLSHSAVSLLSTLGAAILVSTATTIIIPEGVNSLYAPLLESRATPHIHASLIGSPSILRASTHQSVFFSALESPPPPIETYHVDPQWHIGLPLTLGFALMFLISRITPHTHHHTHVQIPEFSATTALNSANSSTSSVPSSTQQKRISATLGLVIHAAADGIAMGSASASGQSSLELAVFFAILLHKAPSAFGLASFLLKEGLSRKTIRTHLLVFSLSAPIAALLTHSILSFSDIDPTTMSKSTGILLLFSAGTFLYVAMVDILPEIMNSTSTLYSSEFHLDDAPQAGGKMSPTQVIVFMIGMCLPWVLSLISGH